MPPTRQRRALALSRVGLLAVTGALLCAGALFTLVRADAASTIAAVGASNDLPPAKGSGAGAGAGAGLVGGPPPPPPPSTGVPAELTATTLAPALAALPASQPVLLEFYAHWCPTCRRFQPEYEAAAAGLETGGGPRVFVARLDCANDAKICATYGVQRFPTMVLGGAADVAAGARDTWTTYDGGLTAAGVESWARSRAASLAATTAATAAGTDAAGAAGAAAADVQSQHAAAAAAAAAATTTAAAASGKTAALPALPSAAVDLGDVTKATALAFQYALQAEAVHGEAGARDAFLAWTTLVASAHPVPACRTGAAALAAALPRAWPPASAGSLAPPPKPDVPALLAVPVCGPPASVPAAWGACAASPAAAGGTPGGAARASGRGYTCGLWQTFHALAAGLPDAAAGGTAWMAGVRGYVRHFFQCSECAAHFSDMATAADAVGVATRSDAVLWAWAAHNRVNARLAGTEAATPGDGDPAHPKVQWPPRTLCPTCAAPAPGPDGAPQWDEASVLRFLLQWYRAPASTLRAAGVAGAPRRALGGPAEHAAGGEGSRPLLVVAVVGLVVAAVVAVTRPPPVRRGAKAAVC